MQVFTPSNVARTTGSKYLGVLVAAKYARHLNEFRRGQLVEDDPTIADGPREKLTTTALDVISSDDVEFRLVKRLRPEG